MSLISRSYLRLPFVVSIFLFLVLHFFSRVEYTIKNEDTGRFINDSVFHRQQQLRNLTLPAKKNYTKLILAYTRIYGHTFNLFVWKSRREIIHNPDPLALCEYRCKWSTNRNDYNQSDAVLFHLYNHLEKKDFVFRELPKRSNNDQKWVLMIREPPAFFYPTQMTLLNNLFNLTMTYQSDSDVVIPYGRYWKLKKVKPKQVQKMLKRRLTSKMKKVVWLVSNCVTSSRREVYVKELSKYIDIDIYGECGNSSASIYQPHNDNSAKILSNKYMFYLAFENSDCDDYITEKLWRNLRVGLIPVVRGQKAKYEKLAPPNSFIHADSFATPKELAEYLNKVANSMTLYKTYHKWRESFGADHKLFTVKSDWMCDLCERVHNSPRQTIDVYKHFSEDTRCFTYLNQDGRNRSGEQMEDIDRL